MIAVIDYDAGNLKSVEKALLLLGEKPLITRKKEENGRASLENGGIKGRRARYTSSQVG